jgi:Zn-dependent protease with chaperone function
MSMTRSQFETLVARMEAVAKQDPRAYRRRVYALAALGYAYIALVVLILLGLTGLAAVSVVYLKFFGVKLLIVVAAVLWAVVRSLRVRINAPTDPVVGRGDAPALFALLDHLQTQLRTPAIHQVQITNEFNAGVTQIPRFGLFGWHRSYLQIGLPLMRALSVPQFEAVLAHELGHISHGHARAGNWIYRLRTIWGQVDRALSTRQAQWGSKLTRPFLSWYVPYFQACSFPLARANEYEADAAAARATSPRSLAEALTNVRVIGAWMSEHYWPGIHAAAKDLAQPAFAPYAQFDPSALCEVPADESQRWLERALAHQTETVDTHPALVDRLAALGVDAALVTPGPLERAERLLGATADRLASRFDAEWKQGILDSWQKYHAQVQKDRDTLQSLRAKAALGELGEPESLEQARLEESIGAGPDQALALRRLLHTRFPQSPAVQFALGGQLLARNDAEGAALVEAVVAAEPEAILAGSEMLRDFYWRRRDKDTADAWHARVVERTAQIRGAAAERDSVRRSDQFLMHGRSDAELQSLTATLAMIPQLRKVYLVRKAVRFNPQQPLFVLSFRVTPWYRWKDKAVAAAAMQALRRGVGLPGTTLILNVEGSNHNFEPKFRRIRGSLVYRR